MSDLDHSHLTARHMPGDPDMPRDAFAGMLRWNYQHGGPQDGEGVRVYDWLSDDVIAEGTWEAGTDQPEGASPAIVHTTDGAVTVPGGVRVQVTVPLPRDKPAVLTGPQLIVAAELLLELAAVYPGEALGDLAADIAHTIAKELDVVLDH